MQEQSDITLEGGCHCGAIRYRLGSMPFDSDFCHCIDCRKATGAPFGVWMDFEQGQVSWLKDQPWQYTSSDKVRRGFCRDCGTSLTYQHLDHPDYLSLSVSTLDEPEAVSPNYHIYTGQSIAWASVDDRLPRYRAERRGDK